MFFPSYKFLIWVVTFDKITSYFPPTLVFLRFLELFKRYKIPNQQKILRHIRYCLQLSGLTLVTKSLNTWL